MRRIRLPKDIFEKTILTISSKKILAMDYSPRYFHKRYVYGIRQTDKAEEVIGKRVDDLATKEIKTKDKTEEKIAERIKEIIGNAEKGKKIKSYVSWRPKNEPKAFRYKVVAEVDAINENAIYEIKTGFKEKKKQIKHKAFVHLLVVYFILWLKQEHEKIKNAVVVICWKERKDGVARITGEIDTYAIKVAEWRDITATIKEYLKKAHKIYTVQQ